MTFKLDLIELFVYLCILLQLFVVKMYNVKKKNIEVMFFQRIGDTGLLTLFSVKTQEQHTEIHKSALPIL